MYYFRMFGRYRHRCICYRTKNTRPKRTHCRRSRFRIRVLSKSPCSHRISKASFRLCMQCRQRCIFAVRGMRRRRSRRCIFRDTMRHFRRFARLLRRCICYRRRCTRPRRKHCRRSRFRIRALSKIPCPHRISKASFRLCMHCRESCIFSVPSMRRRRSRRRIFRGTMYHFRRFERSLRRCIGYRMQNTRPRRKRCRRSRLGIRALS